MPWPDGSVLVGSTVEDVGFDERHTDEAVAACAPPPCRWCPSLAGAPMTGVRTGLRPKGPDDLPILGPSKVVPGLIYATAHYRNGVMFTPLTVQARRRPGLRAGRRPGASRSGPAVDSVASRL